MTHLILSQQSFGRLKKVYKKYTENVLTKPYTILQQRILNCILKSIVKFPNFKAKISQEAYASEAGVSREYVNKMISRFIARGDLSATIFPKISSDCHDKLEYSVPLNSPLWNGLRRAKKALSGMTAVSMVLFTTILFKQALAFNQLASINMSRVREVNFVSKLDETWKLPQKKK